MSHSLPPDSGQEGQHRARGLPPGFHDREPLGAAERVGVVIPSRKETVRTLESIPDGVPCEVVRDGTINEARNAGVAALDVDVVAVMDDDIAFPESTFRALVDRVRPDTLVGMEDWNYGWVAGRVMAFPRDLWADLGGFDEDLENHMGDTEFSMRALANGYRIETVDRDLFDHEDHDRSVDWRDHYRGFRHLLPRYPLRSMKVGVGLALGKLTDGDPRLKDRLFGRRKVDLLEEAPVTAGDHLVADDDATARVSVTEASDADVSDAVPTEADVSETGGNEDETAGAPCGVAHATDGGQNPDDPDSRAT